MSLKAKYPKYILAKPDFSKIDTKKITLKLKEIEDFREYFDKANTPKYLYWDTLRYKAPFDDLLPEETWFLVRQFRDIFARETYIASESKAKFRWLRLSNIDEFLHIIDMYTGGKLFPEQSSISQNKQLIVRGIMEEAIASSQLEGAHTTRAAAQKIILEKREPRNESERMIVNNYRTMMSIEEDYKNSELSLDLIFEIHKVLTFETVDSSEQGRFRTNSDEIVVEGSIKSERYITHIPPDEKFLNDEILRLIDFANDKDGNQFMHPIIKAIFLHFWIGYLHPFTDGNGRLARALFYWYLLRKGYWMMMYIPISTVIKKAPMQYGMAYIYTEQDNLDLTYFFDFQIRKIMQSLNDFEEYIKRQISKNKKIDFTVGKQIILNDRQKNVLHYLASNDSASTTVSSHAEVNSISRQTAAKDLKELEGRKLLKSRREGKFIKFRAAAKLNELLKGGD